MALPSLMGERWNEEYQEAIAMAKQFAAEQTAEWKSQQWQLSVYDSLLIRKTRAIIHQMPVPMFGQLGLPIMSHYELAEKLHGSNIPRPPTEVEDMFVIRSACSEACKVMASLLDAQKCAASVSGERPKYW